MILRADSGMFITNAAGTAPYFPDRLINTSTGAYLSVTGDWTNASDKYLKENFISINGPELLDKIASLPIKRWNFRNDPEKINHIGPAAQDFFAAFGVGRDDNSISTIDPAGIALAAIKELYLTQQQLLEKTQKADRLESKIADMDRQLEELQRLVNRLQSDRESGSGR